MIKVSTALLALLLVSTAQSAEVYSASVPDEETEESSDSTPAVAEPLKAKSSHLPIPQKGNKKSAFESVPSDKIDSVAQRLKLVEQLLRKHGRAYDYRLHTIREFETILSELSSEKFKLPHPNSAE